jgi:hypothetical protein
MYTSIHCTSQIAGQRGSLVPQTRGSHTPKLDYYYYFISGKAKMGWHEVNTEENQNQAEDEDLMDYSVDPLEGLGRNYMFPSLLGPHLELSE